MRQVQGEVGKAAHRLGSGPVRITGVKHNLVIAWQVHTDTKKIEVKLGSQSLSPDPDEHSWIQSWLSWKHTLIPHSSGMD